MGTGDGTTSLGSSEIGGSVALGAKAEEEGVTGSIEDEIEDGSAADEDAEDAVDNKLEDTVLVGAPVEEPNSAPSTKR